MTNFVTAHGNKHRGYPMVNLDMVVRLHPNRVDDKVQSYDAIGSDGEVIATISQYDVPEKRDPVIPNSTPAKVWCFFYTDDAFEVEVYPIIAWRIIENVETYSAAPVTFVELDCLYCISQDDVFSFKDEGPRFRNSTDAIDYAKRMTGYSK